jgi:hypothetical protein
MATVSAGRLDRLERAAQTLWLRARVARDPSLEGLDAQAVATIVEDVLRDGPIFALKIKLGSAQPLVRDLERRRIERCAAAAGISPEGIRAA